MFYNYHQSYYTYGIVDRTVLPYISRNNIAVLRWFQRSFSISSVDIVYHEWIHNEQYQCRKKPKSELVPIHPTNTIRVRIIFVIECEFNFHNYLLQGSPASINRNCRVLVIQLMHNPCSVNFFHCTSPSNKSWKSLSCHNKSLGDSNSAIPCHRGMELHVLMYSSFINTHCRLIQLSIITISSVINFEVPPIE